MSYLIWKFYYSILLYFFLTHSLSLNVFECSLFSFNQQFLMLLLEHDIRIRILKFSYWYNFFLYSIDGEKRDTIFSPVYLSSSSIKSFDESEEKLHLKFFLRLTDLIWLPFNLLSCFHIKDQRYWSNSNIGELFEILEVTWIRIKKYFPILFIDFSNYLELIFPDTLEWNIA